MGAIYRYEFMLSFKILQHQTHVFVIRNLIFGLTLFITFIIVILFPRIAMNQKVFISTQDINSFNI